MLERANMRLVQPERYRTRSSSCTTNTVDHANAIVPKRFSPFSTKVLFPACADELEHVAGLLDTTGPFTALNVEVLISARALAADAPTDFPVRIRARR